VTSIVGNQLIHHKLQNFGLQINQKKRDLAVCLYQGMPLFSG